MSLRKERLEKANLYVIVGPKDVQQDPDIIKKIFDGGADVVQYRAKGYETHEIVKVAEVISNLASSYEALFIVNDDPKAAVLSGADGVHVGQDDLSTEEARSLIKHNMLLGRSTHSKIQAMRAQEEQADYIGFGPLFSTPTKPTYKEIGIDAIKDIQPLIKIPYFAIGGIDHKNCSQVLRMGATRFAVVRAVTEAADPFKSTKLLKDVFQEVLSG